MRKHIAHTQKSTIGRASIHPPLLRTLSGVTPSLAALAAEQLFMTPMHHPAPRREQGWARAARRITLQSPHGRLAAWEWGDGPQTVLLVHGWSGRGLQLGAFAAPLVAAGFRVVACDAPGHGNSPGRKSNLFKLTDGLMAVAEAFGPISGVIAHSLGTAAVLLATSRNGLTPGRFVAISPMAHTRTMTDWFGVLTGFSPQVVDRMRTRLEQRLDFSWDDIEPHRLASGIETDTLIIHDRDDPELPSSEGETLLRQLTSARLHLTQGLGHRRILRDSDVISTATQFINGGDRLNADRPMASTNHPYAPAA